MFPLHVHADRRARLMKAVPGPILLLGMGPRPRNLPMNQVPFRQDSTFLYFTGCHHPGAALWMEDGRATLYLPTPPPGDALWHGEVDPPEVLGAALGLHDVQPAEALEARARAAQPATLAIADAARTAALSDWVGQPLAFGRHHGDPALVDAVVAMRRTKSEAELEAMREAARHTVDAHTFVMRATRPGVSEQALATLFRAWLDTRGCDLGYDVILTQHGEILHNHDHDGVCEAGRLLLLDGGAEVRATGYGADVTRTWPVSGTFTPRQRAAYEAVLEAQAASIALCRAGVRYRDVHLASAAVLARFLLDEGLLRGASPEEVVERGAHALFFPHGVGHHLGLDVHDLENFGDLSSYPPGRGRDPQFGLSYLRLDLPLEPGWVVTVEPGFYVAPSIVDDPALRERLGDLIDDDVLDGWRDFGGIRTEDDVVVTADDPEVLTEATPRSIAEIEAVVGTGAPLEALLR